MKKQYLLELRQNSLCGEAGHAISKMCVGLATKRKKYKCAKQTNESWWIQLEMLLYTKIVKRILSGKRTVHDDTKSIMHNLVKMQCPFKTETKFFVL